jgi:predicted N-formylglutamate amidohydrolase
VVYFDNIVITCEHGGNKVPPQYTHLFKGKKRILDSHRGWDRGTLTLARRLAKSLNAPLIASTTTRLLIDLNRSLHHPNVFSDFTRHLPKQSRQKIIDNHYHPHRDSVIQTIEHSCSNQPLPSCSDQPLPSCSGRPPSRPSSNANEAHQNPNPQQTPATLHLGIHSFTPILDGHRRNADLAILYDPRRKSESNFAKAWRTTILETFPNMRIRMNYPYRGAADGLTTSLRIQFPPIRYLGIELEINQQMIIDNGPKWRDIQKHLAKTLQQFQRSCSGRRPGRPSSMREELVQ